MSLDLTRFYYEHNFKVDRKLAYGIYRDRVISIIPSSMYVKFTISFNRQLLREAGSSMNMKMKELKQKYRAIQNALTTNVMLEIVLYQSADINDEFLKILDECIDIVSMYVIETCDVCPICGLPLNSDAPFLRVRDCVVQAHEDCIDKVVAASKGMDANYKEPNKKQTWMTVLISTGMMLLVVGLMMLAALGNVFDWIASLSGWFMVGITKFLLFRFKIKLDKPKAIIISAAGVLCLILSVFLGSIVMIARQSNYIFSEILSNYILILKNNYDEFTKYLMYDLIFGSLFVGFSIFDSFRKASKLGTMIYKIDKK